MKTRSFPEGSHIFVNTRILVMPALLGKKRISLFESQILKEGGMLCSLSQVKKSKEAPTHIVVEDSLLQNIDRLRELLKTLGDVQAVTVGTRWLSDSIKLKKCMPVNSYKPLPLPAPQDPPLNTCGSPAEKKLKLSKAEVEVSTPIQEESPSCSILQSVREKDFACSQSSTSSRSATDGNKLIIEELQKLADAFRNKGDTWRSHGYAKAISAIKRSDKVLCSYEDALALPGVGEGIASKVWEILETGKLRKVAEVCDDERARALQAFTDIWGVGPSTAESWYQQGHRSLDDIKTAGIPLTKQQEIGLKHYEDFLDRIPREEVAEVGRFVSEAAKAIEPKLLVTLVGSYRRGKSTSGDIDVMICKPDHMNSKDILSQLIISLKNSGFITDDLVSVEKKGNQRKYLGVCRLPGENMKYRRLDIFVVLKSEEAPALMHYTGSALFNRSIRLLAAKKGMSLSEHSLHAGIVREGLKILNEGHVVPTPTEESIFKALDLPYRPPEERDH